MKRARGSAGGTDDEVAGEGGGSAGAAAAAGEVGSSEVTRRTLTLGHGAEAGNWQGSVEEVGELMTSVRPALDVRLRLPSRDADRNAALLNEVGKLVEDPGARMDAATVAGVISLMSTRFSVVTPVSRVAVLHPDRAERRLHETAESELSFSDVILVPDVDAASHAVSLCVAVRTGRRWQVFALPGAAGAEEPEATLQRLLPDHELLMRRAKVESVGGGDAAVTPLRLLWFVRRALKWEAKDLEKSVKKTFRTMIRATFVRNDVGKVRRNMSIVLSRLWAFEQGGGAGQGGESEAMVVSGDDGDEDDEDDTTELSKGAEIGKSEVQTRSRAKR